MTVVPIKLRDHHTWSCPVYVLESKVQSLAKCLLKWEPKVRVGIYLGRSSAHAGNVSLVLNLSTGHVSPQFHVVFDDDFTLVPAMRSKTVPANYEELFYFETKGRKTFHFKIKAIVFAI